MLESIKRVSNPLTIVAIFAGLAEISGTVALGLVEKNLQFQFIWFVMLFPVFLVLLFFITLNFNHRVFYSPGDFSDEANFMSMLKFSKDTKRGFEEVLKSIEQDEREIKETFKKVTPTNSSIETSVNDILLKHARGNVAEQMGRLLTDRWELEDHIRELRRHAEGKPFTASSFTASSK